MSTEAERVPLARRVRWLAEWIPTWILLQIFLAIAATRGIDSASDFGAWLGRAMGPRTRLHKRAIRNLRLVFPDIEDTERQRIACGMWENLGRILTDYIFLHRVIAEPERVEIVGAEVLDRLRDDGRPGILFTGHIGGWEMVTVAAQLKELPLSVTYRNFNNPYIEGLVRGLQSCSGVELIRKGARGARQLVNTLAHGGHTIILADPRMNDGIEVPFFGLPAMTAPALAQLALKYDAPVVPACCERLTGMRYRVTVHEPIPVPEANDRQEAVAQMMATVNQCLEDFIRDRPELWLWLHRRWPKEVYAAHGL
ncbi:MAG: lauroyl acyltransferase [Alphaproteobacteria bacterium]|nr:lauroyl acyltransferase [Alphaproteobacteria bacterium]